MLESAERCSRPFSVLPLGCSAVSASLARFPHEIGNPSRDVRRDNRQAASHRLVDHEPPRIAVRRKHESLCESIQLRQFLTVNKTTEANAPRVDSSGTLLELRTRCSIPCEHQADLRSLVCFQFGICSEQIKDTFFRH